MAFPPPRTDPSVAAAQQNAVLQQARAGVQFLAAAGATQGDAAVVPEFMETILVTCTLSSQGVKLPTAATGKRVMVLAMSARGVKVYPATNDRIHTGATNAAVALVLNKANLYVAINADVWRVLKGA